MNIDQMHNFASDEFIIHTDPTTVSKVGKVNAEGQSTVYDFSKNLRIIINLCITLQFTNTV